MGFSSNNPDDSVSAELEALLRRYRSKSITVGVIGLGYVGLPLALTAAMSGFRTIGFDIDPSKIEAITRRRSYLRHISDEVIAMAAATGRFESTIDFAALADVDAILVCVPTPLTKNRDPDLSFVESTTRTIRGHLRKHHLVVLESTTWPGTTDEIMRPILETSDLVCGDGYFLAFSPEREDPGNADFTTRTITKVVGADDDASRRLALALYEGMIDRVVPVSSTRAAEATKLTENIFRAVNIALVNELKVIFDTMGVDIWEVIDAAKTKPFGFMAFYPGPGLGGHCIPIDPFYLTWKAREYEISTKFIELAGEINTSMPNHVVARLGLALDRAVQRGFYRTEIVIIGVAYKKNIDDMRESPALRIIEQLEAREAKVSYYDPLVPVLPPTREHARLAGRRSVSLLDITRRRFAAAVIVTDHDDLDYDAILDNVAVVVDTRNVYARRGVVADKIVKA
ncbi:nucleotide sugar dehydrogenase [Methylosinus trichosporium]|uniref:Nucleotide sugar dehydrogenase n=1 Tax=Methylosinus trichosporium (strain ATCC 35070 / NCIMB 11131 / UNIQEM 75 / OB3b) TaxID=595536 RepID=A0A2D2CV68_METT3|nr:nucleotide sugar dehydrogenase [Methylosinus trichosporium OB3b]